MKHKFPCLLTCNLNANQVKNVSLSYSIAIKISIGSMNIFYIVILSISTESLEKGFFWPINQCISTISHVIPSVDLWV